jgi:hypothetical protein
MIIFYLKRKLKTEATLSGRKSPAADGGAIVVNWNDAGKTTIKRPHAGKKRCTTQTRASKVLSAGRRWGKTRLGVNECIDAASRAGGRGG